jgi:hypothetical protein
MNSVDVLLAGWGSMDFDAQISQGRQAVDLLGVWYDSAVGYLGQLIALQGSMHDGIGRARENLMLEGMNDAEKRSYAHRGLNQSLMEISHARTGEDLQAAYDDFMRFWQIYKEVGGAGNSGSLFWWLDRADAAVDTASERIQDPIQEQADAAADALGEVIERLTGTDPDSMTWALQQVTDGMSTTSQAMSDFELAITGGSGGLVRFNELIQRVNDTLGGLGYGGGYDDPVTPSQPIDSDAIATGIARGLALASTGGGGMTTRTDAVSGEVSRHESWAIEIGFDEPLRLTDCDHAVAVLGDLFEPWDIRSVSAPLQSRGGPCSVTLGDDGTLDAREIGEPLDGRTIKVYRVTHPGPDQVVEDIWQGVIDEVSTVDRASMTITGAVWGFAARGPLGPPDYRSMRARCRLQGARVRIPGL